MEWLITTLDWLWNFSLGGLNGYGWICLLTLIVLAVRLKSMGKKPVLFIGIFAFMEGALAYLVSMPYRMLFSLAADKVTKDLLWYLYYMYFVHIFFAGLLIICLAAGRTNRHKWWYLPSYFVSLGAWLAPFFLEGIKNQAYITVATSLFIFVLGAILVVNALRVKLFTYEETQEEVKNA